MFNHTSENLAAVNLVTAINETYPVSVPPQDRASVIRLLPERKNNKVIIRDEITHRPIEESFSNLTARDRAISQINLDMLYQVEAFLSGTVGIWLSPPDPWRGLETGKILVVATRYRDERRELIEYDVTGRDFTPENFSEFSLLLQPYYRAGYFLLESSDSPWLILPQVIPMPKAWENMQNGVSEQQFGQKVEKYRPMAQRYSGRELMDQASVVSGANPAGACPTPTDRREIPLIRVKMSPDGKELHYVEHCGMCGAEIKKYIKKGAMCKEVVTEEEKKKGNGCTGVYEGC